MGEQKAPTPNQNQTGQNQPGKQAPGQEPRERASNPDRDDEAARRQSKQDPLQNRDR